MTVTGCGSLLRRFARGAIVAPLVLLVLPVSSVRAHAQLDRSTPAANSVLEEAPTAIVLDFDDAVEADLAVVRLFDSAGRRLDVDPVRHSDDDTVLVAPVGAAADGSSVPLGDGLYAVVWRTTSADGHVVEGGFAFTVGTTVAGDGQALLASVRSGLGGPTAWRGWSTFTRATSYLALVGLLGVGGWLATDVARRTVGRRARSIPRRSALVLAVSSAATFGLQGAQAVGGSWRTIIEPSAWADLAGTRTGALLIGRVLLASVAVVLLRDRDDATTHRPDPVVAVLSICMLVTFAGAGHAASATPIAFWVAVDALHVASWTAWLGGLVVVALAGRGDASSDDARMLVRRVSGVATVAVGATVLSGVALTLGVGDGWSGVRDTDWGDVLVAKVATVAVMLAVAGLARRAFHRSSPRTLWGTVVLEAAIGVVVIGLASGVVVRSPDPERPSQPYAEQLAAPSGLIAIVSLSPGSVGSNEVHIVATPPGGSLTPVAGIEARVVLRDAAGATVVPSSPVTLRDEGVNHVSGSVVFPRSGEWTLEVTVRVNDREVQLLKGTVRIP